jgi:hypothetical protein
MLMPEQAEQKILLGIAGRDDNDRYELCAVTGVRSSRPVGALYDQGFANWRWSVAAKMTRRGFRPGSTM